MPKSNSTGSDRSHDTGFDDSTSTEKRFAARILSTIASLTMITHAAHRKRQLIMIIGYLTLALEALQLLSFVQGDDTVPASMRRDTWPRLAFAFRSFYPSDISNSTFLFFYIVCFLFLALTAGGAVWLVRTADESVSQRRRINLPLLLAMHLAPAMYVPMLWTIMSPLACSQDGVLRYHLSNGDAIACWSTQYIIQFLLAVVGVCVLSVFGVAQGLFFYNPIFRTNDPLSRQFSYIIGYWRAMKVIVVLIWVTNDAPMLVKGIALLLTVAPVLLRLLIRGIFYKAQVLVIISATLSFGVGAGIALVVEGAGGAGSDSASVVLFWSVAGVCALIGALVAYIRVRLLLEIAHSPDYDAENEETLRLAYVLAVQAARTDDAVNECGAFVIKHLVKLSSTNPELRDRTIMTSCEILIENGLNLQLCYLHMSNIMRRFRISWLFDGMNQLCLRYLELSTMMHDAGMSRSGRHVQKFARIQRTVVNAIVDFYDELDASVPDTNRLLKRISYIDQVISRAEALYKSAVIEDPSSTAIMYAYAFFLSYVLRDAASASQVRSLAGTVEGTASTHGAMLAMATGGLSPESKQRLEKAQALKRAEMVNAHHTMSHGHRHHKHEQEEEAAAAAAAATAAVGDDGEDTAAKAAKKTRFAEAQDEIMGEADDKIDEDAEAAAAAAEGDEAKKKKGKKGKGKKGRKGKATAVDEDEDENEDEEKEEERDEDAKAMKAVVAADGEASGDSSDGIRRDSLGRPVNDSSSDAGSDDDDLAALADLGLPDFVTSHPLRGHAAHADRRHSDSHMEATQMAQLERGLRARGGGGGGGGGGGMGLGVVPRRRDRTGGSGGGKPGGTTSEGGSSHRLSQLSTQSVGVEKHRIMSDRRGDLNGFVYALNCALLLLLLAALSGISASLIMLSQYSTDMDMLELVGHVRDDYANTWGRGTELMLKLQGVDLDIDVKDAKSVIGQARENLEEALTTAFRFIQNKGSGADVFFEFVHEGTQFDVFSVDESGLFKRQQHMESVLGVTHDFFVRMTEIGHMNESELFEPESYVSLLSLSINGLTAMNSFSHIVAAFSKSVNNTLDEALYVNLAILIVSIFVLIAVALGVINPAFQRMARDRVEGVSLFNDLPRPLVRNVRTYYTRLLDEHDDLHDSFDEEGTETLDDILGGGGGAGDGGGASGPKLTREEMKRRGSVAPNAAGSASKRTGSSSRRSQAERVLSGQLSDKFKVWRFRMLMVLVFLAGVFGAIFGVSFAAGQQLSGFAKTNELASLRTADAILVRYMMMDFVSETSLHWNANLKRQIIDTDVPPYKYLPESHQWVDPWASRITVEDERKKEEAEHAGENVDEKAVVEKTGAETLESETTTFTVQSHYKLANQTLLRNRMLDAMFELYQTHQQLVRGDPELGIETSHNRYEAQSALLFDTPEGCTTDISCEPLSPLDI